MRHHKAVSGRSPASPPGRLFSRTVTLSEAALWRFGGPMWHEYERRKADWIARHPDATPEEYEAAIRKIVREVGV